MAEGRFSKLEKKIDPEEPPEIFPDPVAQLQRSPVDSADYPTFIQQGDEAYFTGNYRDALRHYSRALQEENTHVYPWIGQISSLIELKQYREAELWSNKALEQFPEDSSLLSQRARVLALTGNLKRAMGASDYALTKGATSWSWLARGDVLLQAGEKNALLCFEKAVEEAGKEDWHVPLIAGMNFSRRRQWASAQDFLRRSVETNPKNYFSWCEYGRALHQLSFFDRAQDAITRSLQLKPDYKPALELERISFRTPLYKRFFNIFRRKNK